MAEWFNWLAQDWWTWEYWQPKLGGLLGNATSVVLIAFLTWLALRVRNVIVQHAFRVAKMTEKQEKTLQSLLLSLTKYIIFIISSLMILANLGLEVGPIIAGAGVVGLAIGFGAQTLVKDFITGFFIIFEDQFSVGDYVSINNGEINGTVVEVGLRATKIRTWAQHVVVIQNSEIRISQNYNRERMRAIVNFTVPYEVNPSEVERAVHALSAKLVEHKKHLFILDDKGQPVEPPQLYGITDVENQALGAKYTITALAKDSHYWTLCNDMRKGIVHELQLAGIRIAYPRRVELRHFEDEIASPVESAL